MAVTSLHQDNGTMIPTSVFLGESVLTGSPTPLEDEMQRLLDKQRELEEFYSTYDVWTGIRTAITLALFFVFTVTLILYKSKCKPRRKYELYPSLEDMPGRPLDYYDYWCSSPGSHEAAKADTGVDALGICYNRGETGSAPLPTQRSIDSYSSLNNSFRVKSLPGSVMRINCSRNSSFERDEAAQAHEVRSEFLSVPGVRLQSTGSSSDGYSLGSSMHDLSGEMTPMALLGVPRMGPRGNKPLLQLGGMDWDSDHATAEWIQTIDINVIQPTPNISPCGSVRSVSDNAEFARLPIPGRGRIPSIMSLDSPEFDNRSIGSDSVFMEDSIGETYSSRSESMDSPSPSLLASPRPSLTPSPHSGRHKVQSFRLGINPSMMPAAPSSPVPTRARTTEDSLLTQDRRNRHKPLQRQQRQELPLTSLVPQAAAMTSLVIPSLGGNLRSSCEHLAAHSTLMDVSKLSSSQGSSLLAPTSSTETEPMCAVFTVPSLRRCNSAQAPDKNEESVGWKRADSEQASAVRRSDSASGPQRQSSESSTGSDDASESVSFHLMVPALSIDYPSADTSRASSPSLSPPSSPNSSPPLAFRTPTPQSLHVLEPPVSPSPSPSPNGARTRGVRSNGRSNGRPNGRRMLRRQYSQCIPPSPTLLDVPLIHTSLPTYVEEDDPNLFYAFPAAPPPSPFREGQYLYMRRDSGGPPSPYLAAHSLNRQESSPTMLHPDGYHLLRQDSSPTSPHHRAASIQQKDSSPTPYTHRTAYLQRDSSPTSPCYRSYLQREDSSPTPSHSRTGYLQREDSSPTPSHSRTAYLQREDSSPTPSHSRTSYLQREDSSPTPYHSRAAYLQREDSSPTPSHSRAAYLQREDSSPTPPHFRTAYLQREDSSPTPSHSRTAYLQREDSSPTPSHSRVAYLQRKDSSPTPSHSRATCLQREDSSPTPSYSRATCLQREDSSPTPTNTKTFYFQREDSSPTPTNSRISYLQREDSSPTPTNSRISSLQREDSTPSSSSSKLSRQGSTPHSLPRQDSSPPSSLTTAGQKEGSQSPSSASSVMETSC